MFPSSKGGSAPLLYPIEKGPGDELIFALLPGNNSVSILTLIRISM